MASASYTPFLGSEFKMLFEANPQLLLVLDPQFKVVAVTDSYLHATMTTRELILGRSALEIYPQRAENLEQSQTHLLVSLQKVVANKTQETMPIFRYSLRRPHSSGGQLEERQWRPCHSPVLDEHGEVLYVVSWLEDVTDLMRLQVEKSEQNKAFDELRLQAMQASQALQTQRMEAMGQLAGGVAHDFNNILAVILLTCENVLEDDQLASASRSGLEQIKKVSERAASLTRQLLAFSRKQVLQPKATQLNAVVLEVEKFLKGVLPKTITLQLHLASDLEAVFVDHGQLEQVVLNLVGNARDAMPAGGSIVIETSAEVLHEPVSYSGLHAEAGRYAVLTVRDGGVGMNSQVQSRLFEPFFTTKAIGQGPGLGLSMVYGIVSQSHGTIRVESELQKGTVFKIYLPIYSEKPLKISRVPQSAGGSESLRGQETVLVVDDQPQLRELVQATLAEYGYKVLSADNGRQALALAENFSEPIDLLVSDVIMPEMGGPALAEKILAQRPQLKILFMSGYAQDAVGLHAGRAASSGFLEKPFRRETLLRAVREYLDKK